MYLYKLYLWLAYVLKRCLVFAKTLLDLPKVKSAIGQSTFKYSSAKDWNSLPSIFREMTSITSFKSAIYMYLLDSDKDSHICS